MCRQKIEDVINEVLVGDEQKNALEFTGYLREKGMTFEKAGEGYWKDKPYWLIKYKEEYVCFVFIHGSPAKYEGEPEGWIVWTDDSDSSCFENYPLDDGLKEIAWQRVDVCGGCNPDGPCAGGRRKTIFGRNFDHVCRTSMIFINADSKAVDCLKKLMDIRREDILSKGCYV